MYQFNRKEYEERMKWYQDARFGMFIHWGLYSIPARGEWVRSTEEMPEEEYLPFMKEFDARDYNPKQWAKEAKAAGMKYVVLTAKHHDGFCMFDSKYTDFSIANGPFANNPKKDVARYVFDAFRQKDFMIGCYFSKPDWHCEWFWNPYFATPNRRQNYKIDRHPDWWKNYQEFTYNQMDELMTNYGNFDILWLDGGWVTGEDVHLDKLLNKVRTSTQPGLISVDRTIRGRNENYQTPERSIPETQLNNPWESCITLSNDWGWVPNAPYKSPTKVIGLLAEITAKGGCLLLGVGPTPQGTIEDAVAERLHVIGDWLRANGKAIYNTRITPVYNDGNVWFTADKDGKTLYAVYALPEGENLPETIEWTGNIPTGKMKMLKGNKTVKYTSKDGKVRVTLPKGLKNEPIALQFASDK